VDRMLAIFHAVIRRLLRLECPVVGVVRGAALGGGCELLMACDVVLAHEDARIGQPEIKLGAFPPAAAALLPRLVGRRAALAMILTGRPLVAAEAKDLGLVTEVFGHDVFDAEVREYVAELAGASGPVLRLAKRTVQECQALPVDAAIGHAEEVYLGELMRLADPHEGLAAFMEKRPPAWRDR
jgi:cyclohexa-1,5-dienecarbonyl-CoA hydratase